MIIFDKQVDALFTKSQRRNSPSKTVAVCSLLLSLGCIWGMFSYPPEINCTTETEEFYSTVNQVEDESGQGVFSETKNPGSDVRIEEIKVFYTQEEKNDFTMHVGDASVTIWAKALPDGLPEGKSFEWTCSDNECLIIESSDDSVYCTCSIIKPKAEPVELIVSCDGMRRTILIFLVD